MAFDYVVIGAGTAGCVVAGRLAEQDKTARILLVEAGGRAGPIASRVPAASAGLLGHRRFDWRYPTEPDASRDGRSEPWTAGRLVGGTGALNGMLFVRGSVADYDAWEAAGSPGWRHADVLPSFRSIEHASRGDPAWRGFEGPWPVAPTRTEHPLCAALFDSYHAAGISRTDDYNGAVFEGAGLAQVTQRGGLRVTTAQAFLPLARSSGRLRIAPDTACTRLLIENGRCVGAALSRKGSTETVAARQAVVVCAGAIGSPALLLRSGIGADEELAALGVRPTLSLPGVGRSLMDHPVALMQFAVNCSTYQMEKRGLAAARHLADFLGSRRGVLASPHAQVLAHVRTRPDLATPDIQIAFYPMAFERTENGVKTASRSSILFSVTACQSHSRGRVALRTADPRELPRVELPLLDGSADVATLIRGCRLVERVLSAGPMKEFVEERLEPSPAVESDADWEAWLRAKGAVLAYHASGTCRMGPENDAGAVVDASLRVRGIDGLRVADTSIMPSLVSANTQAAAAMIGARAATMLLDQTTTA